MNDPNLAVHYDRHWIAAHIPHQGGMCLLDAVCTWDAAQVTCRASSHRDPTNPLRHRERLGAICAIEYAAQAMAVHAALLFEAAKSGAANAVDKQSDANARPASGLLTSARAVELHVARLDDVIDDLLIEARRLSGDAVSVLYSFTISAAHNLLASGRAAVVLDAERFAA